MMTGRTLLLLLLILSACSPSERDAPDAASSATQEMTTAIEPVASGAFIDKGGQKTSGSYRIERNAGDLRLVLEKDFRTDEGPDLHVVLTRTEIGEAANDNVMVQGAEVLGRLAKQSGEQVYDLPDDLRLEDYRSVVIHCIKFSHLYGAAPLG